MATVWKVPDERTSRLIADFYRFYLRTTDKSRSLREAQIRLIRSLRAGQVKVDTPFGRVALPEHPKLIKAGGLTEMKKIPAIA